MPNERGLVDWEALQETERVFRNRLGDLLADVSYVPNAIGPVEIRLTVGSGYMADSAWFDIQWWENHGYTYHYQEDRADQTGDENREDTNERARHTDCTTVSHRSRSDSAGAPT